MRVAVVSDIHSNLHALEAVLAEINGSDAELIWCLGDVVGYGPKPEECTQIVMEDVALSLCGNHDLGVLGEIDVADFAPDAASAALWTRGVLSESSRGFLAGLRPLAEANDVLLFHASPRDPVWEYVLTDQAAAAALALTTAPIVLVGHSHVPLAVTLDEDGELDGGHAPAGTELELGDGRWLLNPGSVGQPRDGDSRAAWLDLDLDASRASFRRTDYPIGETVEEIREAGLPPLLGERLWSGA
ncbi:MAG TPA: metallophosphoesterase family protein [Gaiellaceae bacterium]|jgi:diadenosine tetraphosphatase ApaH/serine/threonine PP2A family protein phosphatase|nr:metallophosphoesterase family protein [Gaiellaceae bacterium]